MDGGVPDDLQDDLIESRIYVVFFSGGSGRRAFGPYRTVQVTRDSVWAFEGSRPLRIALKQNTGAWEIPDGSDQPALFRHAVMLCPSAGLTAEQLEERLRPRAQD